MNAMKDTSALFNLIMDTYAMSILKSADESETEYGEPQLWIPLPRERQLEITHEENGLNPEDQYYSWRVHCSEDEFEQDKFRGTMGVIATVYSDNLTDEAKVKENLSYTISVAITVD